MRSIAKYGSKIAMELTSLPQEASWAMPQRAVELENLNLWHLKQCPLFTRLTPDEIGAIFHASQIVSLGENEIVPAPLVNEPALWIVKRGHVKLAYVDSAGREATVLILSPGDIFGAFDEMAQDYGEHCRTMTSACLCRITRSKFDGLVKKYPDLAFQVTKANFDRIHRLQIRMAELLMRPVEERLAITLVDLDKQVGEPHEPNGRLLALPLTHRDLSLLIGSSREMVTHVMRRFRAQGLVDTLRKQIVIKDLEALKSMTT